MKFIVPENFEIKSAQRTYPVQFSDSVSGIIEKLKKIKNPVFLVDANIARLYQTEFEPLFSQFPTLEIEATEDAKSFEGIGKTLYWMSDKKCTKSNHVVAIGGGIIQDIVAFAAGVFFRGLPWTLVPTTLLAMADSCIGAKSGLNLNQLKNQLGLFNSPHAVLLTPAFLMSLPKSEVKSGYGEILKLHLTAGYDKFLALEKELNALPELLSVQTGKHIADSLLIKKKVIEEDEYETYLRMILNYGHTFGHALEAETHHFVPHGMAVAWGLDFENFLSKEKGWLSEEKFLHIQKFIKKHLGFQNTKPVTAEGLLTASRRDKKMTSGSEINLIYFTDQDQLEIKKTKLDDEFQVHLSNYLLNQDVFKPA